MSNISTKQAKLQPPGAGLPFYELMVAKLFPLLVWPLTSQAVALEQFKAEADKILALVATLSKEQASTRILIRRFKGIEDDSRNWSVFMVLDHLRIVDEAIAQCIEDLVNHRRYDKEVRIQNLKPRTNAGEETVETFIQAVKLFEATVKKYKVLIRTLRHPHPWFGPLDAHGWLCLAAFHHRIHRRQIERIIKIIHPESKEGLS